MVLLIIVVFRFLFYFLFYLAYSSFLLICVILLVLSFFSADKDTPASGYVLPVGKESVASLSSRLNGRELKFDLRRFLLRSSVWYDVLRWFLQGHVRSAWTQGFPIRNADVQSWICRLANGSVDAPVHLHPSMHGHANVACILSKSTNANIIYCIEMEYCRQFHGQQNQSHQRESLCRALVVICSLNNKTSSSGPLAQPIRP